MKDRKLEKQNILTVMINEKRVKYSSSPKILFLHNTFAVH